MHTRAMKLPASGLTRTYTASALWTGGGAGAVSFNCFIPFMT